MEISNVPSKSNFSSVSLSQGFRLFSRLYAPPCRGLPSIVRGACQRPGHATFPQESAFPQGLSCSFRQCRAPAVHWHSRGFGIKGRRSTRKEPLIIKTIICYRHGGLHALSAWGCAILTSLSPPIPFLLAVSSASFPHSNFPSRLSSRDSFSIPFKRLFVNKYTAVRGLLKRLREE